MSAFPGIEGREAQDCNHRECALIVGPETSYASVRTGSRQPVSKFHSASQTLQVILCKGLCMLADCHRLLRIPHNHRCTCSQARKHVCTHAPDIGLNPRNHEYKLAWPTCGILSKRRTQQRGHYVRRYSKLRALRPLPAPQQRRVVFARIWRQSSSPSVGS